MVKPWFHVITHISNYIFISSILENFFGEVRYHPLIENFPEYTSLSRERVPFNQTEKFSFGQTLTAGRSYERLSNTYFLYLYLLQLMTPVWIWSPALTWPTVSRRRPSLHSPVRRPEKSPNVTGRTDQVSSFLCSAARLLWNMLVSLDSFVECSVNDYKCSKLYIYMM